MKSLVRTTVLSIMMAVMLCGCSFGNLSKEIAVVDTGKNSSNTLMYGGLSDPLKQTYDSILEGFLSFKSDIEVVGSEQDIKSVYDAILADRPDIFYVSGYVYDTKVSAFNGTESNEGKMCPNYTCNKDEKERYLLEINQVMSTWFDDIDDSVSDYEKSKRIFEEIAYYDSYDKEAVYGQNMISAYLFNETISDGYSAAYTYALQRFGIPSATVSGTLNGSNHSWNIVYLDKDYYLSDLTNGDSSYVNSNNKTVNYINYSYFNMNPAYIKGYIADPSFNGITVNSMNDNYYVKESRYFTNYNPDLLGNVIKEASNKGEKILTLSFSSIDVLNEAIEKFFDNNGMSKYIDSDTINYMTSGKFNTLTLILSEPATKVAATPIEDVIVAENEDVYVEAIYMEPTEMGVSDYYHMVPSNIRGAFDSSDWKWSVYEDGSLASKYGYSVPIMGLTCWNEHEIVIDRRDESKSAIIHELGHWANHYYNAGINTGCLYASFNAEWENLYREFGGSVSNYNTVEEYGASAFEYYVLEPERLCRVAPYTYNLFNAFVNDYMEVTNGVEGGERVSGDTSNATYTVVKTGY